MTKRRRYVLISLLVLVCGIVVFSWPLLRVMRSLFFPSAKVVREVVDVSALPRYRVVFASELSDSAFGVGITDDSGHKTVVISKMIIELGESGVARMPIDPDELGIPETYPGSLDEGWELISEVATDDIDEFQEVSREVVAVQGYQFPILRGTYIDEGESNIVCLSTLAAVSGTQELRFYIQWMSEEEDFTTNEIKQVLEVLNIN